MYHYAANNPVRYTDPDGRSPGLAELREFAKEIRSSGKVGERNLYLNPKTLREECCFARASIIAEGLRNMGYKVDYAYVNHPKKPNSDKRFNYHIAACVKIDGEIYVVDPLYNHEGKKSGLSKFEIWRDFQEPDGQAKDYLTTGIKPGYDNKGNVKENKHIYKLYEKYNENKKLSIPDYAEKLMEYYKKTGKIDEYDGGNI